MNETNFDNNIIEPVEKKSSFKDFMLKRVSTLWGGIMIGGAALLMLLVMLIIWLCN